MIADPAVPRAPNGGPALCHLCQRMTWLAGSFLEYLLREVELAAHGAARDAP